MRIQRIAKAVLLVLLASLFLTGGISVLAVEGINAEIPVSDQRGNPRIRFRC